MSKNRAKSKNESADRAQVTAVDSKGLEKTMGKETKIGLAVIGILLIAFGVVLVKRLAHSDDGPLAAQESQA